LPDLSVQDQGEASSGHTDINIPEDVTSSVAQGNFESARPLEQNTGTYQFDIEEPPRLFSSEQLDLIFDIRRDLVDHRFRQEMMEHKVGRLYDMLSVQQQSQHFSG